MQALRMYDPLYGRTSLNALEARLMGSPEVQRLRNVRMCNVNSLLISGASQISRFEHSLGVVRLAKEWGAAAGAGEEDIQILSAAALLHDIKTGPFGHSLEYILSDNPKLSALEHEKIAYKAEEKFFQSARANISYMGAPFAARDLLGKLWPKVATAISGDGPLGKLINGSIDLDNIDNVVRLAYHAGLATKEDAHLALQLARDLRPCGASRSISPPSVPLIRRWQAIRHRLYRYLLHDWAEFSAKGMLTKAIEMASDAGILGTDSWILTDDGLIGTLINATVGDAQEVRELTKRLMLGALYEPVMMIKSRDTFRYKALANPAYKRSVEIRIGSLLKTRCVMHVIIDQAKTSRKIDLIIREDDTPVSIGVDSAELLVGLFVSRAQNGKDKLRAQREFTEVLRSHALTFEALQDPLEDPFVSSEQMALL
jgi:HD superfamily phosphohydrolase